MDERRAVGYMQTCKGRAGKESREVNVEDSRASSHSAISVPERVDRNRGGARGGQPHHRRNFVRREHAHLESCAVGISQLIAYNSTPEHVGVNIDVEAPWI